MNLKALWTGLPRAAKIYLAAVGGIATAAVAATVTVAAASPSPSPSASPSAGQAYCNTFTNHLASNLGKTSGQVSKAISDAIGQTVDDAVKNGDLTQKQADAIKSKLGSQQACAAGGVGRIARGGFGIGDFPRGRGAMNELAEYAKALGISQSELQQDLRSGKTVKDIAASKGMDEAAFRSKLVSVTRTDLDGQVKAGNLTQKQEDALLQRLQDGPLPLWDRTPPKRHGPSPTPTPSTGTSGS